MEINANAVDVLLVEDNTADAELTIRELKKHRLANNLVHLKDGEEALDFLFGNAVNGGEFLPIPKMILLDIKMPKVSGLEVLQKIKSEQRTKQIPVIMLTSSAQDPDIHTCYEMGANSYIVKPVDFEGFTDAIKNLGFYWLLLNHPSV